MVERVPASQLEKREKRPTVEAAGPHPRKWQGSTYAAGTVVKAVRSRVVGGRRAHRAGKIREISPRQQIGAVDVLQSCLLYPSRCLGSRTGRSPDNSNDKHAARGDLVGECASRTGAARLSSLIQTTTEEKGATQSMPSLYYVLLTVSIAAFGLAATAVCLPSGHFWLPVRIHRRTGYTIATGAFFTFMAGSGTAFVWAERTLSGSEQQHTAMTLLLRYARALDGYEQAHGRYPTTVEGLHVQPAAASIRTQLTANDEEYRLRAANGHVICEIYVSTTEIRDAWCHVSRGSTMRDRPPFRRVEHVPPFRRLDGPEKPSRQDE